MFLNSSQIAKDLYRGQDLRMLVSKQGIPKKIDSEKKIGFKDSDERDSKVNQA